MNKLKKYLELNYPMEIIEDPDEGGYVVSYPDLPGCITTGDTIEKAITNARDAKKAWLQAAIEDGITINKPNEVSAYSGQFKLRLPKT